MSPTKTALFTLPIDHTETSHHGSSPSTPKGISPSELNALPKPLTIGEIIYENSKSFKTTRANIVAEADKVAEAKWGLPTLKWLITTPDPGQEDPSPEFRSYSIFYEHVINAASHFGFSPEFLHAVAYGEGMIKFIDPSQSGGYDARKDRDNIIDSYDFAGLDMLGKEKDTLLPSFVPAKILGKIVPIKDDPRRNEVGQKIYPAKIYGLEAAVFLIAARLYVGKNAILAKFKELGQAEALQNSDVVDFFSYAHYNRPQNALDEAINPLVYSRKYTYEPGETRTQLIEKIHNKATNARFNCLIKMVNSERMKLMKVYR